jgi:hypothetical protein
VILLVLRARREAEKEMQLVWKYGMCSCTPLMVLCDLGGVQEDNDDPFLSLMVVVTAATKCK